LPCVEFLETRFEAAVKVLVNEIKKERKENQEKVGKLIIEKATGVMTDVTDH
jgi:hypothetical protein